MVAESVLLLVVLLIAIAYILLADRKIWAAVQIRRGPNVVGPVGPVPVLRRPPEVRAEGADHSGRRQQGRVPAGAAGVLRAGARRLGGDPDQSRLGDLRHQCRRPLHLRDLVAVDLRHHHGRLVVELEISVPGRAALGGADGVLRSLDRLRHHHGAALRRLAESVGGGRGAEAARLRQPDRPAAADHPELVRLAAVPDVRGVLRLGAGGDQPSAVRPGRSRIRTGRGLHGRIRLDAVSAVHARRICRDHHDVRAGDHPVPRRLAAAGAICRRSTGFPA